MHYTGGSNLSQDLQGNHVYFGALVSWLAGMLREISLIDPAAGWE